MKWFVGDRMYTSQAQKPAPNCSMCGRRLGVGYYFSCHVCGRNYCYAHIPVKCSHLPAGSPGQPIPSRIRR